MTLKSEHITLQVYDVEGVNVLNKGTLDEWMAPHPVTYNAHCDRWSYKIKLDQYLKSINKLMLIGIMESLVRPGMWAQVRNWDKDLLVIKLTLNYRLMRYNDAEPDAKHAHTVQGMDILHHWCNFAYAMMIFQTLFCADMFRQYTKT